MKKKQKSKTIKTKNKQINNSPSYFVEKSLLCSSSSELIKAIITFKELIEAGMDAVVCATEPTLRAKNFRSMRIGAGMASKRPRGKLGMD